MILPGDSSRLNHLDYFSSLRGESHGLRSGDILFTIQIQTDTRAVLFDNFFSAAAIPFPDIIAVWVAFQTHKIGWPRSLSRKLIIIFNLHQA